MNFWKIVKISFRHRWNIVFCIITALGVGLLWGMNLSAVFPFMQITFKGETMQTWAEKSIAESTQRIEELERELAGAEAGDLAPKDRMFLEHKIKVERATRSGYELLHSLFCRYLPTTPFGTIVVLLIALLGLTILKTLFLIANSVLVARIANETIFEVRNRLYDKCLALEVARYNQEGSAVLMSRITNDVAGIGTGLTDMYGKMIREPLKMFVCLGIALWINWQLFVVTLCILPLIAWAIQKLAK